MPIEVHYQERNGQKGVVNYFSQENTSLSAGMPGEREAARRKLLARAHQVAAQWGEIFPETKFEVKELEHASPNP